MKEKYPALYGLFEAGYGLGMAKTRADSIEKYGMAMGLSGDCADARDGENLYNLVWLMRSILSDCCGVSV